MAVVLFLISLAIALVYQRFVLRRDTEGAHHRREGLMAATSSRHRPGTERPAPRGSGQCRASPVVYFVALRADRRSCSRPVVYIILGGFRTNAQITVDPAGLPNPWQCRQLHRRPGQRRLLAPGRQLDDRRCRHHACSGRAGPHGELRPRALPVPRPRSDVRAVRRRSDVPDDGGHHAAVHPGARTSA